MILDFEVKGTRGRGRTKKTWLKEVFELSRNVVLNESDANNRVRWRFGVTSISRMMR